MRRLVIRLLLATGLRIDLVKGLMKEFFLKYPPGSDFDGVICDTFSTAVEKFNLYLGTNYIPTEVRSWSFVEKAAIDLGITRKRAAQIQRHIWYSNEVLAEAQPKVGALEFIDNLRAIDLELPIITSRLPENWEVTKAWCRKWLPDFDINNLHLQRNSEMARNVFKAYTIQRLKLGSFIEDWPHHAQTILGSTDAYVILLSNIMPGFDFLYRRNPRFIRITSKSAYEPASLDDLNCLLNNPTN